MWDKKSGTLTVRPSSKPNVSRSSVIRTVVTSGGGVLFSFIPRLNQFGLMGCEYPGDFPQLGLTKAFAPA